MATKPVQLPSGNWRSIASLGRVNGKEVRKSFTAPTKREAYRKATEHEAFYRDQIVTDESRLPLGEAIDRYIQLKEPVLSPSTIAGYRNLRRNTFQSIMGTRLCDLNATVVQKAISEESVAKSPKTVRNASGLLSSVLRQYHPTLKIQVRLPQKRREEICIPSLADINALIEAADQAGHNDLALAIMFGAQLGLRRSEICALTFGDIKNGNVTISKALVIDASRVWQVKPPKSNAGYRTLPLTDQLKSRIDSMTGKLSDRLITLNPDRITRRFEDLQDSLGIFRFRFHDLRHYNASVMISLGIPAMYITRRLGHSSDDMVKRVYGHLIHDKQENINKQMTDFFK